jgi:hypothetical protein
MQLLYFSPVHWDSYEQRPHYFVRHFLEEGGRRVVWINPHTARLPHLADRHRLSGPGKIQRLWLDRPPGLTVMELRAMPIDPLPGGAAVNRLLFWRDALATLARDADRDTVLAIGRPTALARAALQSVPHAWSLYDAMDDFPEFYRGLSRHHTRTTEAAIAARVDRLFVSSHALAAKFASLGRRVTPLHNAYDMALLPPVQTSPDRRRGGLGFLGCIGRWFDWPLTIRIAQAVDPLTVTLVGPCPVPSPSRLPQNLLWRPECHQADTIAHLASFAAGLIPFTRDRLTSGIDPIKYYQYRGAGLPVLSTSFGDMAHRTADDDTFFLDRDDNMAGTIRAALGRPADPAKAASFRAANTWTARFTEARVWCAQ